MTRRTLNGSGWIQVLHAHECPDCEMCEKPVCPHCEIHYADCPCPGPRQDDEFEYTERDGILYARPLPEDPSRRHDD